MQIDVYVASLSRRFKRCFLALPAGATARPDGVDDEGWWLLITMDTDEPLEGLSFRQTEALIAKQGFAILFPPGDGRVWSEADPVDLADLESPDMWQDGMIPRGPKLN